MVWEKNETKFSDIRITGQKCRLFPRQDYIDNEKHLIPWMGNTSRMVDRYDARNLLDEESSFIHKEQYFDSASRLSHYSLAEQKEEELCENERYLDLYASSESEEDEQVPPFLKLKLIQKPEEVSERPLDTSEFHAVAPPLYQVAPQTERGEVLSQEDNFVPLFPIPKSIKLVTIFTRPQTNTN